MIRVRLSKQRGYSGFGWLQSYHSFSFGDYSSPEYMAFRKLRVLNEDIIAPGKGFATHSHQNMEILTYVVSGALKHKDSMGNSSVIKPGEIQYMSAGSGVSHSEFNHSASEPVHLLQIWILPNQLNATPRYDQRAIAAQRAEGNVALIASGKHSADAVQMLQDVSLYASRLKAGQDLAQALGPNRYGWIQLISGKLSVNGTSLEPGDGAALSDVPTIQYSAQSDCHFLSFDLG